MKFIIRGDKIKITDAMKDYIEEKLGKLDKYLKDSESIRANVVVKVKNINQIVEITIPLKNIILRSEESQDDFYKAVDKTVDKLERQIRKNKTRLSKHSKVSKEIIIEDTEVEEDKENIIKRKKIEIKPMNEEEAILQMELLGHEFYMYMDSEKDKHCVVYKRKDGGYGILES
ncbi:MAG: ribosome-associated translation inhibitor RaiA [Bacilli bacterium]|nr:ribosome-associated translation inhibitor RaiA [Bacilli bacterium]